MAGSQLTAQDAVIENGQTTAYKKILILTFAPETSNRAVVCNLARLYDLTFNILRAKITPRKQGYMTLEIIGSRENYDHGIEYLKEHGVQITSAAQKVSRNEDSCVQCGMCTAICPSEALHLDLETRMVLFDPERCTACAMCTTVCPVRAMYVEVENEHW